MWKLLHVSFPALDFFVENHSVEALFSLGKFPGQIEMGTGNKAEAVDVLLHHAFSLLNPFGNFHFLLPAQERNLAHLLEIHPHRVVQNIELGSGFLFLFFLFLGVFFSVLVPVHLGGFNNVDLHTAQSRENEIELIGVGDPFGQRLV